MMDSNATADQSVEYLPTLLISAHPEPKSQELHEAGVKDGALSTDPVPERRESFTSRIEIPPLAKPEPGQWLPLHIQPSTPGPNAGAISKPDLEPKGRDLQLLRREETLLHRDQLLDRKEREFERRDRELDRRERELERRERELERRQREFEQEKARLSVPISAAATATAPLMSPRGPNLLTLEKTVEDLRKEFLAERKKSEEDRKNAEALRNKAEEKEAQLEARVMKKVEKVLEKERQTYYGFMRMSDHEVNEMVEDTVGYLMQKDEDIADRVRFQSLLHLSQEKLALEAGLQAQPGSESLAFAWRSTLGPSFVTEDRYNKALELLKDRVLEPPTTKLIENKQAMEYLVEYTSHLRKEGSEMGDHSFTPGRISREAYLESVGRQGTQTGIHRDALVALVDYVCPESSLAGNTAEPAM